MGEVIGVMRDGAVVQRGTPDDIYDQPDNLYVAAKIGAPIINTMSAKLTATDRVETPLGAISIAPRSGGAPGVGEAILAIRPSDIRIAGSEERGPSPQRSICSSRWAISRSFQLEAKWGRADCGSATRGQAISPEAGRRRAIAFDTTRIHLFRASDGTAIR